MKLNKVICLLFRFINVGGTDEGTPHGRYRVIQFFDETGKISLDEIMRVSGDRNLHPDFVEFETKEELTDFALKFLDQNDYENAYLLSTNDFNIGIESCHNIEAFKDIFKDYGTCLTSTAERPKSLFGKIFD